MANSLQSMFDKAVALKKRGRLIEAIDVYRAAAQEFPDSAVAEHNLAGALGDAGRWNEAETHIRRAFGKGLDAPQTWLVYARTLMSLGKVDEAKRAYEQALDLNPAVIDAQRELAQLIWMTTGDSKTALNRLDSTIASFPDAAALHLLKAQALRAMEGHAVTFDFVTSSLERWPDDVALLEAAADAGIRAGRIDAALDLSQRVASLEPGSQSAIECRISALLAAGRAREAVPMVEKLVAAYPNDQYVIALLATTCRLVGDDRHAALYNYEEFVRQYELTTPEGWSSLDDYLGDLRSALSGRHPYTKHPFMNSLDGGSMIMNVASTDNEATGSLLHALTPAIDAHVACLGTGDDVVRSRNTGRWKLDGIWSVYLLPNGFHHDHVHPAGWISSACYIALPDRLETGGKEGWIKFGEPGIVTEPRLSWEYAVKPEPGMLVLFPSYMWHGTIPFGGDQRRMTCALDIVPA